jgi:hypothetical protein
MQTEETLDDLEVTTAPAIKIDTFDLLGRRILVLTARLHFLLLVTLKLAIGGIGERQGRLTNLS